MDVWYELRLRELSDLNEAATELLRKAEALLPPPPDKAEEEK